MMLSKLLTVAQIFALVVLAATIVIMPVSSIRRSAEVLEGVRASIDFQTSMMMIEQGWTYTYRARRSSIPKPQSL